MIVSGTIKHRKMIVNVAVWPAGMNHYNEFIPLWAVSDSELNFTEWILVQTRAAVTEKQQVYLTVCDTEFGFWQVTWIKNRCTIFTFLMHVRVLCMISFIHFKLNWLKIFEFFQPLPSNHLDIFWYLKPTFYNPIIPEVQSKYRITYK